MLGRAGSGSPLLDATVAHSPHEADADGVTNALPVIPTAGAAQCVWHTQPAHEFVELLI